MIRSDGYGGTETLLFLIAIVLGDLGLEQDAIRFVFGFNINSRDFLFKRKEKHRDVVSSVNEESERSGCGFAGLRLIRLMRGWKESRERMAGATSNECAHRDEDEMEENVKLTPEI